MQPLTPANTRTVSGNGIAMMNGLTKARTELFTRYQWMQRFCNLYYLLATACVLPLLTLAVDVAQDDLGSNAIQALHIRLGDWSLRFLCVTLAITPIQTITRWRGMAHYRQLFGLYSFFYGTLHVFGYLAIDQVFAWWVIGIDILQSSYLWFGIVAYMIIFLLGITSSKAAKKTMGKRWKKLHRFIYPASVAAVVHYFWQLKGNLSEPFFYASSVFLLLLFRMLVWYKDRQLNRLMIPRRRVREDD